MRLLARVNGNPYWHTQGRSDGGWDVLVHNIDTQGRQTTAIGICAQ